MSFQAGIFYFDERPIGKGECGLVLNEAQRCGSNRIVPYRGPGVFIVGEGSGENPRSRDSARFAVSPSAITFDGRLDDRRKLLVPLGDVFQDTASDAALACAAYGKWGAVGLAQLIGDWSLVIWDASKKTVVLASDYAGVRPLYYCVLPDRVLWSSHLGFLAGWVNAEQIDDEYVGGLLLYAGCPNRTPYRGIYSVPPGHTVEASKKGTQIRRFWEPPVQEVVRYARPGDYEDRLWELFRDAVRFRLSTDSPVLSDLSGGLDSSSIVCMARDLIRKGEVSAPQLVTLTFEHPGSLDAPFYKAVERYCGVQSVHTPAVAVPLLTRTNTGVASPAFSETLHERASSVAREVGAQTYLSGRLGDLIMGNWWDDSDQVAGLLRNGRIGMAFSDALRWSKLLRIPVAWVLWRACLASLPPAVTPIGVYRDDDGAHVPKNLEDSIAPAFRRRMAQSGLSQRFSRTWLGARPERRRHYRALMEAIELRRLQAPEPLQHLNYTHPFAHRPLVSFMLSIPAEVVCRPGEPRRLMRRAFHNLWPPGLRTRRSKDSFGGVFLDALRPLAMELLERPGDLQVVERGYVDRENLNKRLHQLVHSLDCNEPQLRQIILLEFWLRGRETRLQKGATSLSA